MSTNSYCRINLRLVTWLITLALTATPVSGWASSNSHGAIVKVFAACSYPDYASPWQKYSTEQYAGSGAVIDGKQILTNAHVIAYAVDIQVSRHGDPERYPAAVVHVDHARDLALITVEDAEFFDGPILELGELPGLHERVKVLGFPVGGETLSVTEGVLSRIETDMYAHSFRYNLVAQLDASINSGNSGGPVLANGTLIGLAMQSLEGAENVGYCIPAPVLRQFFTDIEDGRVDGPPVLGIYTQEMHSQALRQSLGMPEKSSGCLVNRIVISQTIGDALRVDDVILEVDGHDVANDGTVDIDPYGRVNVNYLVCDKQVGDEIELRVLRDGRTRDVSIALQNRPDLVAGPTYAQPREYAIVGGAILAPLDMEYLVYLFDEIPYNLGTYTFVNNDATSERDQAVVLVRMLPHRVNQGYQEYEDLVLDAYNGETVRNFAHLQRLISKEADGWVSMTFRDGTRIVMDAKAAEEATAELIETYGVRYASVSRSIEG